MPENKESTPDDALATLAAMVQDYNTMQARSPQVSLRHGVPEKQFAVIFGLNAQAHTLAEATLPMWSSPTLSVAARPLARSIFECGIVAQWLMRDPEAIQATFAEYERQRRALANQMDKIPHRYGDAAKDIRAMLTGQDSPKANIAKSLEKIAQTFEHGDEIYIFYRLLSGHSHAGLVVVDEWLNSNPRDPDATFALRATVEPHKAFGALAVMGLLYTASAFGDLIKTDANYNNRLNRHAKRTGVDRRLTPKPTR